MDEQQIPEGVLAQYDFGPIERIELLSGGLIHRTYKVVAGPGTFILQRLHPVLSSPAIAEDFRAVTTYLHEQRFLAPQCVPTKSGKVLAKEGAFVWRAQTALKGKTVTKMTSSSWAKEAGHIYARFHKVMDGMPYQFKSKKVLHDTEQVFATFEETIGKFAHDPFMNDVKKEVVFIQKELPKLFLPHDLPLRVIHGDPKISNILFSSTGKAKALVDLDTCNRRPILVELGDAFRSWCGVEEDRLNNRFRLPMFKAGWKAYRAEAGDWISARECSLVPQAIGLITLELASRFLTDYFTDNYFGWNEKKYPSRRAHNLARVRGQIALYKDLKKQMREVKKAVK